MRAVEPPALLVALPGLPQVQPAKALVAVATARPGVAGREVPRGQPVFPRPGGPQACRVVPSWSAKAAGIAATGRPLPASLTQ